VDVPWVEVACSDRGPGETEVVFLLLERYLPAGKSHGRALFTTNDPTRPNFTVVVQVLGRCAVRPLPAHVFLRPGQHQIVHLLTEAGLPAHITAATPSTQTVAGEIVEDGAALLVSASPGAQAGLVEIWAECEGGARSKVLATILPQVAGP
jgi:hypothetical protein